MNYFIHLLTHIFFYVTRLSLVKHISSIFKLSIYP